MKGWTYDVEKPGDKGAHGLTLRNVAHAGESFAAEIGVDNVWINPGLKDDLKHGPFVLGVDFEPDGAAREEKTKAPFPFDGYQIEKGISQAYTRKMDGGALAVRQTYRLSAYGADPPHEPSGLLQAGRIFPYVTFETANPKIASIRIDYRMHIQFGAVEGYGRKTQAGVFRDSDELPAGAGSSIVRELGKHVPGFTTRQLFADAEKPILYEILGQGVIDGAVKPESWDNVHIWPRSMFLPSTPGAFYAGHMHWRWSRLTGWPTVVEAAIQEEAGLKHPWAAQFRGPVKGGPLVDPGIQNQTIRFAIAKAGKTKPPTTENFGDLFLARDAKRIADGDDLEIWFSVEVKRDSASKIFRGTVFLHGLYFAHEVESQKNYFAFTIGKKIGEKFGKLKWKRDASL